MPATTETAQHPHLPWSHWAIDASMGVRDGMFCFCPLELNGAGEIVSVVVGMNFLSDAPPKGLMAVVHESGDEAVAAFCEEHEAALAELSAKAKAVSQ